MSNCTQLQDSKHRAIVLHTCTFLEAGGDNHAGTGDAGLPSNLLPSFISIDRQRSDRYRHVYTA